MELPGLIDRSIKLIKNNSPEILTALGVSGVVLTSYLAGKASFEASSKLSEEAPDMPIKEQAKKVWKFYIPAGISGAVTITCVIGASKASRGKTAAAVTAYSLTERAFSEYKEKVIEQIGKGKEQKIRDEIAQDHVKNVPPKSREIIVAGGHVMCCELYTHRYFRSDMEALRKAQNEINFRVVNMRYVTLSEFYDLIGLPYTSVSDTLGWDSEKLMELQFSTVISEEQEPCLAFNYNYVKPV